jgi:hypothetical protein
MGLFQTIKKQKSGQVIEAKTLRDTATVAEWAAQIKVAPPLEMMAFAAGPLIRLAGAIFGIYIGVVATGGISARVGTTPGSGNFTPQTWNGTVLANLSANTLPCYSISSTTAGIPSGTYIIVIKIYNVYWVCTADCGN